MVERHHIQQATNISLRGVFSAARPSLLPFCRSAVRDNVTGAGVAYPLFRKGVEKERFDRGVYLLGRDVEQMLTARGVPAKRGAGQLLRNLERLMSIEGV